MKIVYIFINDGKGDYEVQALLSIFSLKFNNPSAEIILITDKQSINCLSPNTRTLYNSVDVINTVKVPTFYDSTEKSRFLKTNLRNLVEGDFIYMDLDTIVTGSLTSLCEQNIEFAAVLNRHRLLKDKHSQVVETYESTTGHRIDKDKPYFNSGVMMVRETSFNRFFFHEWHHRWVTEKKKFNVRLDQPTLSFTNEKFNYPIREISGIYNCQIKVPESYEFLPRSKIIHYFATDKNKKCIIAIDKILGKIKSGELNSNNLKEIVSQWEIQLLTSQATQFSLRKRLTKRLNIRKWFDKS